MTTVLPPEPLADRARTLTPFETGPGTPAGRYLRSFWQPIARSVDLEAGQAQPVTIMSEELTLFRGESGRPVVMDALCPHRLTKLSIGNVEGDAIRCQFHGWKFGADGRCVEAPLQTPALLERVTIGTRPVREEFGLIFVYLGEGPEPEFPDIAAYSRAHGYGLASAPVLEAEVYRRYCNWYLNHENSMDLAHVPYTHALSANPELTRTGFSGDAAVVRDFTVERLEYGVRVEEVDDEGLHARVTVLFPNVMHLIIPMRIGTLENLYWRVPIDDESHKGFGIMSIHTDEEGAREWRQTQKELEEVAAKYPLTEDCAQQIIRGEKRLIDFVDHPKLQGIEDALTQQAMRHIADANLQNLGRSDRAILQLRRMFLSRVAEFVAGEPSASDIWPS
ncbi:ring-hydroxylating oxygenase subunit alpha [Acrocarpospora pleiomorpha]|uniref:Ring-hydroxylating oxygenase subunit alpha n=1 Tax=Acrocarpospora pleiomorpha TaxID=90975 RepID=A0A5M3XBE0_9ACTN|nr:Rieske 2Fe-2S domain-containing protein [Acrocarpospora pleiomorpha]GES17509.1 ring-hydroxylating oxygenase subunit alpha [Acrocarpospora pleiomorpha]